MAGAVIAAEEDSSSPPAKGSLKGVPDRFRTWIDRADAACEHPELTRALLAAQLWQEGKFSTRRTLKSGKGARGPAQFLPGTWATWGRDDDGNDRTDPYDVGDAVMAQGRMMCSLIGRARTSGYPGSTKALALAGYNSGWNAVTSHGGIPPYKETTDYIHIILRLEKKYAATPAAVRGTGAGPDAVRRAATQLGEPYAWGGGTPSGKSLGFCDRENGYKGGKCVADKTKGWDCSSLTQYAHWRTTQLPRLAADQYKATAAHTISRRDLKPGDLLFWTNGSGIYHVAMYYGDGKIIHAPRTGKPVQLATINEAMPRDDYYAATRPVS